jgi:stage V sporulation protein AD
MNQRIGVNSMAFEEPPVILAASSVVGEKEGQGPLGPLFEHVEADPKFGMETWEEAESAMQGMAASQALAQAGLKKEQVDAIFAGDLLGQLIATSFGLMQFDRPVFGVYGACSTMGETLMLASMAVAGGFVQYGMALTSSHFASAEKQFRFPLPYGNQRPLSATWTVVGSAGVIVTGNDRKDQGIAQISAATPGRIVDFGVKDSLNMGACMAPAACDTICQHLLDFNRKPEDYDAIITGDLGSVGQKILFDLVSEQGYDIKKQHLDCGMLIFDAEKQDTHAGGSGCGCSAVTLAAYILPKIQRKEWQRVLFVPTGALLSTVSFNEGKSVPGIAHAVVIESL